MSWFSTTEYYDFSTNDVYGEPEISYSYTYEESDSGTPSSSGPWDDYQHERERIYASFDEHTR